MKILSRYLCTIAICAIVTLTAESVSAQTATPSPTPFLYSSIASLTYTGVTQGSYQDKIVTFRNIGGSSLSIYDIGFQVVGGSNGYSFIADDSGCITETALSLGPVVLAVNGSACVKIRFSPTAQTDNVNVAEIYHTATAIPRQIILNGAVITLTPTPTPTFTTTPTPTFTPTPTIVPDKTGPTLSLEPYLCGSSLKGRAADANGISKITVELYESTSRARSWEMQIDSTGFFEIKIDYTNPHSMFAVTEGTYRVVSTARDSVGNETKSEYQAFITNRCAQVNITPQATSILNTVVQYVPKPVVTIYQQIKYVIYPTPTPITIRRVLVYPTKAIQSPDLYYQPVTAYNNTQLTQVGAQSPHTTSSKKTGLLQVGAGTQMTLTQIPYVTIAPTTAAVYQNHTKELLSTAGIPWYFFVLAILPIIFILIGIFA